MILVIGTTTVDLLVTGFDRLPRLEGDEFTTNSLVFCRDPLITMLGGNGANSAYVLGRLGARTALCSALGQDALGRVVDDWLASVAVDTTCLVRSPTQATPTTTMLLDAHANRLSFHHAGPSFTFTPAALHEEVLRQAGTVLLTGYPLLRSWRPNGVRDILATAHAQGSTTALDLGPAIDPPAKLDEVRPLLPHLDYLLCNTYELNVCTDAEDWNEGVQRLREAGSRCVILKQGDAGAVIAQHGSTEVIPGFPAEVPFTVGAGDAFNAGFLYALAQGLDLKAAVRFAHATASLVVRSGRGVLGCPALAGVESLLRHAQ